MYNFCSVRLIVIVSRRALEHRLWNIYTLHVSNYRRETIDQSKKTEQYSCVLYFPEQNNKTLAITKIGKSNIRAVYILKKSGRITNIFFHVPITGMNDCVNLKKKNKNSLCCIVV